MSDPNKNIEKYDPGPEEKQASTEMINAIRGSEETEGPKVKKAFDLSNLSPQTTALLNKMNPAERARVSGAACGKLIEPVPEYIKTECEVVHKNENNAWIVLGRDRPGNRETGYGGKGYTQAGSIDIVVGRGAGPTGQPRAVDIKTGEKVLKHPEFHNDAARIYISQKTDIDENFDLANGIVGVHKEFSGIGIKADGVRIIGRQGVKIVTGGDLRGSQGQNLENHKFGIDLISNNDDSDLQPIVKGYNLLMFLESLITHIDKLAGNLNGFVTTQMKMNEEIGGHIHRSPHFAKKTLFSLKLQNKTYATLVSQLEDTKLGILKFKHNAASLKGNYLKPDKEDYICSEYNFSN